MITILIADDHQLFREGLARVLNDMPELTVVATASNGEEAMSRAAETRPNVILMDLNMPGVDGVEAAHRLRITQPQSHILMLTVSEQEQHLFAAIRAGARGYLLKSMASDDLVDAIRRANAGEAIVAPVMATKLLDEFAALSAATQWRESGGEDLSQRERDVLRFVAQGLSNKEIGAALSLSPHTIKAHLRSILDKLQLRNRTEVAAWAARHDPPKNPPD
jgi:NarL family two-component system response regulator LiaR